MNLQVDEIRAVRLHGPSAAKIEALILEWTRSPFWTDGQTVANWFESSQDEVNTWNPRGNSPAAPAASLEENTIARHIRASCQRDSSHRLESGSATKAPELALVDRYVSRPGGAITDDALRAIDEACQPGAPDHALLSLFDGRIIRASVPTLLALVATTALMSCVRYPVQNGIGPLLGTVERKTSTAPTHRRRRVLLPPRTPIVDVMCVLPTNSGRKARAELVASPVAGVAVGLYPLVASVIPEASGELVPLLRPASIIGSEPSEMPITKVSRFASFTWQLSRKRRVTTAINGVIILALVRLRKFSRRPMVSQLLRRLGIEVTASRDFLTRLLSSRTGNPWIARRERENCEFSVVEIERVDT